MKNTSIIFALLLLVLSAFSSSKSVNVLPVSVVTTSTTLTPSDHIVIADGTGITLTLPSAAANTGLVFVITNQGDAQVTLSPSVQVEKSSTLSAMSYRQGGNMITIVSDGLLWRVVGQ
jgi:copper(I)-binding protein